MIDPVRVLQVPDGAGLFGGQVGHKQGGGGVGVASSVTGELFGDLKVAQLNGRALFVGPVGDAVGSLGLGSGLTLGQHDNQVDVALKDHLPKVQDGIGQRTLSSDVKPESKMWVN